MQASFAQHGVWVAERTGVPGPAYHLPLAIHFEGALDTTALLSACSALVARHETLRARVREEDGVLFLRPSPTPPPITHHDLSAGTPDSGGKQAAPLGEPVRGAASLDEPVQPAASLDELVRREVSREFEPERGPLARFTLFTLAPERHVLLFVAHHLVFDGGSKDVLVHDLAALYGAHAQVPSRLCGSYGAHAEVERARVEADREGARDFWTPRWRDEGEVVLPGSRGPGLLTGEGGHAGFALDGTVWTRLVKTAEELGVTRFEFVVAALRALLHRYGNHDLMLALDLGTRGEATRDHIGLYVNELPLSARPAPDTTFRAFATDVRTELRELYRFRHVPLTQAVGGLTARGALTPVSVSYRKRAEEPVFAGVDTAVDWMMFPGAVRNTLNAQFVENSDGLSADLRYDAGAIGADDARRLAGHFVALLTAAAEEPDTRVRDLPVLSPEERELVSSGWNATRVAYPQDATVVAMFAERVRATPDAEAVVHDDRRLTYAELDAVSSGLARRLRREGAGPGTLVALHVGRSWTMIAGMLAVMKAGAAYLPLDPGYPPDRLSFILTDAAVRTILTDDDTTPTDLRQVRISSDVAGFAEDDGSGAVTGSLDPADVAYVIYTSGSTGRPKGVAVPHSALANLLLGMRDLLGAAPGDAWLALTSLSFDISALELLLPLVTGGRVVVAGEDAARGPGAVELIRSERVSHVQATPSGWRMLLAAGFDGPDVVALAGGEGLPLPLARELRGRVKRLLNVYGPTETTIWSTAWDVPAEPEAVSIGRPIANTAVYVLDDQDDLAPIGVPGELVIAGAGVAQGYLGRPGLTRERFVPGPFGGGRVYRTGDRARWRADGTLEYLGRTDNQVKLRGHRIEPGEIEARLLEHPLVGQAAVIVRDPENEDATLAAYLVLRHAEPATDASAGDGSGIDVGGLRAFLGRGLPRYMIPDHFTVLDALPLTPNGKLDRSALPDPAPRGDGAPVTPGGETVLSSQAAQIRAICQEVLRIDGIEPDDDLFDLGAHSLTITQIASRVRQRLGLEVPLSLFFDAPTFGDLLTEIANIPATRAAPVPSLREVR
ncbi:amino acid adenylation domain-containing protein [Sphaerisporangium sp. NBC_01403]|uniref:non-ribosomal peptide synthetase n=1 Tax=Sphaerisporangium sp. NBC_01403 TaxID=2903599 RepID=UPI0032451625